MNLRRHSEALFAVLLGIVCSVYFTFPLALHPASLGRVDSGDGQFSIWNVAWVAHALVSPDASVFNANIFYPHSGTLIYSEANLGAGLLGTPGYWITGNPYVAHNTAVLISFAACVVGMYFLSRRLWGSRTGAVVAAIVFSFSPHLFAHTPHIQLLMVGPLPFVLLALHAFVDAPGVRRALLLGVAIAVQALFCAYYGVLVGLMVALGILYFSASRGLWRRPSWWGLTIIAAAASILIVLPFFLPYLELQHSTGFGRRLEEAREYSADWQAYFASSGWLHDWMLSYLGRWNEVLFPGFAAILFGAIGAAVGWKRKREITIFYLLIAFVALWSSFGPDAGLYTVLYHTVPVFSLLRAPARFGLAVTFALAVLSAAGVAALMAARSGRARTWIAAACVLFASLDVSMTMPFRVVDPVPKAYEVLAGSRFGPVAEFPFFYIPTDFHRHSRYVLGSTAHWQPLVNGYSDYIPHDFVEIAPLLASFPNPEGFDILRARRARYAVFHLDLYNSDNREATLKRIEAYKDNLKPLVQEDNLWLFEIVKWPEQHPDLSKTNQ
jgi:4-amino-4-deoxy-L-arabinose transferase-like glycosyltransferase